MKRILLMDDSPIFLEVARTALESAGFEVVCASDLAQLQAIRDQRSDLVLMDVQMPEAFGDDIAMTLRFAHDVAVPIYLLSSLDERDLEERAEWAKIDGYISKNRGMDAIVAEVRKILGPSSSQG
ncbi:MAG TPA: response regulator [Kofleriaceae bacterium]|nr:response regulator [Kofleriaceae bacterium]